MWTQLKHDGTYVSRIWKWTDLRLFRSQVWLTMSFAFDDVCWPSGLLPTMKGRGKENKMQKKTAYFVLRCILYSHQNLSAVRQMIVCHRINAWLHARQSVKYNMIFQKCQQVITMILIALLHVSIINRGIEWQAIHSQLFIKELTSQGRTDEWHVTGNKLTAQVITRPRKYQPCPKHVTESMFDISTWNAEKPFSSPEPTVPFGRRGLRPRKRWWDRRL